MFKITVVFLLLSVVPDFQVRYLWSEVVVVYVCGFNSGLLNCGLKSNP